LTTKSPVPGVPLSFVADGMPPQTVAMPGWQQTAASALFAAVLRGHCSSMTAKGYPAKITELIMDTEDQSDDDLLDWRRHARRGTPPDEPGAI